MAGIQQKVRWQGGVLPAFVPGQMLISPFLKNGASRQMKVDGESTPVTFEAGPVGSVMVIDTIILQFLVNSPTVDMDSFAGQTGSNPLSNGILLETVNDAGAPIGDWMGGFPICTNSEFGTMAGPDIRQTGSTNQRAVALKLDIDDVFGARLFLNDGEALRATVQDNLLDTNLKLSFLRMRMFGTMYPPGTFTEKGAP